MERSADPTPEDDAASAPLAMTPPTSPRTAHQVRFKAARKSSEMDRMPSWATTTPHALVEEPEQEDCLTISCGKVPSQRQACSGVANDDAGAALVGAEANRAHVGDMREFWGGRKSTGFTSGPLVGGNKHALTLNEAQAKLQRLLASGHADLDEVRRLRRKVDELRKEEEAEALPGARAARKSLP